MKNIFRKILMSVIYVMLVMPAWSAQKLAIKVVDTSGKAIPEAKVTIIIYNETSKYKEPGKYVKTGSDGLAVFSNDNCDVFKHGSNSGISIKVSKSGYEDGFVSGFNASSDCTQSVTLKTVAQVVEDKKKEEARNCATSENDSSISAITKCVDWGGTASWKTGGCTTSDKNAVATCKAVSQNDSGYQAKKNCWIIVGASRLYLPAPSNGNIYRCTVTSCKGDYELKGGRCQKKESAPVVNISGTVVDAKTNEPLEFANVALVRNDGTAIVNAGCVTNSSGVFSGSFKNIPDGAKMVVSYLGYAKQTLTLGQNLQVKLEPGIQLSEVNIEEDMCSAYVLAKLHAISGVRGTQGQACIPTACVDTHTLVGTTCVEKSTLGANQNGTAPGATDPNGAAGTASVVTDPNGAVPGTTPGATDPNVSVTVTPVVAPAPKVATCQTPVKVDAVRSALGAAPADMDKQKFLDSLESCNVVTLCELLSACVKSMPASVACTECEKFIRDIVNYHNK